MRNIFSIIWDASKMRHVLGNCNVSVDGKIRYMPVYFAAFIRDDVVLPILSPLM